MNTYISTEIYSWFVCTLLHIADLIQKDWQQKIPGSSTVF